MPDTMVIHRPDPMQDEILGPFLRCLNEVAREDICSNIKRRQDVIERLIEALIPVLEDLRQAGIPLAAEQFGNGVIYEAKSLLTEIDAAMNSEGAVAVWRDLVGGDDSRMQKVFWEINWEMFDALDRFKPAKQPA